MNARKWIGILLFLCIAFIGIQVIRQVGKQVNLTTSMSALLMDYNTAGEAVFRRKLMGVCKGLQLEVDPKDLRITADKKANRLYVQVTYKEKLWLLFVPWERTVTVKQEGTLVEL